jgi:hypothetical protein
MLIVAEAPRGVGELYLDAADAGYQDWCGMAAVDAAWGARALSSRVDDRCWREMFAHCDAGAGLPANFAGVSGAKAAGTGCERMFRQDYLSRRMMHRSARI